MSKTVIIMRGHSGSGKSTWISNNVPDALVCSADFYFSRSGEYKFNPKLLGVAHQHCKLEFARSLMADSPLVVVDNTNTTLKEMKYYVETARRYGYMLMFIRLDTPVGVAAGRNLHGVPRDAVQRMKDRMQDIPDSWGEEEVVSGV